MNIFATDINPIKAARDLCDQHVRSKMIVESAQLLQNGFPQEVLNSDECPKTQKGRPRKSGWAHHPCSKWVVASKSNFIWLLRHALEMCRERERRWPNSNPHFSETFLQWVVKNLDKATLVPNGDITPFAIAINNEKNCRKIQLFEKWDPIKKYKAYIALDKPFATWTNSKKPIWVTNFQSLHLH